MVYNQLNLENTKGSPFTSLYKIKENLMHWAELEILQNGFCIASVVWWARGQAGAQLGGRFHVYVLAQLL